MIISPPNRGRDQSKGVENFPKEAKNRRERKKEEVAAALRVKQKVFLGISRQAAGLN